MRSLQLALLTLAIAAPAAAQNVGQFSFDLDVPEGHFSYWAAEDIGAAEVLEAEIAVTELRRHRRYAPVFGLHLTGAGGASEGERVSLMLTPTPNRRALTGFLSVFRPGSEEPARLDLPGTFALDDTLSVRIDWSSDERVVVALAGESMSLPASWLTPVQFRASASTGQMKAYRLALREAADS